MAGQGSARVSLKEIDLSRVREPEVLPEGVPAAVVGPAKRGPAFVPKTFANMQQFGEVFGSMQERSKESNANRFGPLALNEWMRNAQAGTFLRVLGVGDSEGRMNSDKTVEGAGFVVGDKITHDDSNQLQENLDALIGGANVDGAAKAARTHFLGCFMRDATSSTLLQDAGLAGSSTTQATARFSYSGLPSAGDTITLVSTDGTSKTYEFHANGQADGIQLGNVAVVIGASDDVTYDNFVTVVEGANGHAGKITISLDDANNTFVLTQDTAGTGGNRQVVSNATNLLVEDFATATAPIIRGLLMTPRGVVPALDTAHSVYTAIPGSVTVQEVGNGANIHYFGNNGGTDLIGYEVGVVKSDQSFKLILNGFNPRVGKDSEGSPQVLSCSFDPEDVNYFANVLNTDPTQIESRGHYLHMHWDIDKTKAVPSASGVVIAANANVPATLNRAAFCMHTSVAPKTATSAIPDFESYDTRFRTACSPWFVSQDFGGLNKKLFKLHALDDGETSNDRFRILISNIAAPVSTSDWGTFDLTLEAFYSDPISGEALASWKKLSLDPSSKNFIGRVIGTKHMYYDFDRASSKQKLVEEGDYEVRNKYVRVELSPEVELGEVDRTTLVAGFSEYRTINSAGENILSESGDDGVGNNSALPETVLDTLAVLPLPLVKNITRTSGLNTEASEVISWGVKFSKYEKSSELNDIRFNPSIKSWTMFVPDMAGPSEAAASKVSSEVFSLEKIAVDDAADIDWSTSVYARDGVANGKQFITLSDAASVGRNVKFLKFRCLMQGGFDGVNIFDKQKAELTNVAAFREANDETNSDKFTGPTVVAYKKAIDVLEDKSATEFQLLAIPGLREPLITDYAMTACESRFDAMLVMDIEERDEDGAVILSDSVRPDVGQTTTKFAQRRLDSSFAAAYFPDVVMRRTSNGSPLQVPPSVGMLGVMSQNDTLADPWFAPAGLTRGRLNALHSKVQMNRDVLNDLYDEDINPIYEPSGRAGEVYAFGQKTLMQNPSALDRINVRRLLISLRRRVKAVANTLLFEPNRASTLARFSSLVEPIMAEVQARQGVERYKVQIDTTTTTQNDVENNTIRGKIYLQPTKSVEFISLDFVVTNSID